MAAIQSISSVLQVQATAPDREGTELNRTVFNIAAPWAARKTNRSSTAPANSAHDK